MVTVRKAGYEDAAKVAGLIRELANAVEEESTVTTKEVIAFCEFPGGGIFVAEDQKRVLGVLSYSIRPSLFHSSSSFLIEELVVTKEARGKGIGSLLLKAAIAEAERLVCAEISVSTGFDNENAIKLYRSHGLVDESLLLEKHL